MERVTEEEDKEMKRGMFFVFILLIFLIASQAGVWGEEKEGVFGKEKEREWLKQMKKFLEKVNGNFLLEGEVRDKEGNLIDNVKIIISKTKLVFMDTKSTMERRTINGRFCVKAIGFTDVTLEFWKEGYYPEKLHFAYPEGKGGEKRGRYLINRNIKVVMEKIGELPSLVRFESYVRFYSGGRAVIIDINKGLRDPTDRRRGMVKVEDLLENLSRNLLPSGCIYLIPQDINARGKFLDIEEKIAKKDFPKAKLVLNDPGGGFLIYTPSHKEWDVFYHPLIREMKEAPEEGYVNEIEVPIRTSSMGKEILFYFKVGSNYGKGSISPVAYIKPDKLKNLPESIGTWVTLWLNPSGERNVRTSSLY